MSSVAMWASVLLSGGIPDSYVVCEVISSGMGGAAIHSYRENIGN